jgi:hypothetical protein
VLNRCLVTDGASLVGFDGVFIFLSLFFIFICSSFPIRENSIPSHVIKTNEIPCYEANCRGGFSISESNHSGDHRWKENNNSCRCWHLNFKWNTCASNTPLTLSCFYVYIFRISVPVAGSIPQKGNRFLTSKVCIRTAPRLGGARPYRGLRLRWWMAPNPHRLTGLFECWI